MAEPKVKPKRKTFMEAHLERREAEKKLPLVAERWYVDEKWPDWKTYNEYNYSPDYHTGKTVKHGYWDNEAEALKFIEDHVPTHKDGKFTIRHQYLRTHTKVWNEWGWV